MCIIIDACTFSCVFDAKNKRHRSFVPVLNWLISGNGKMIYGGTKYNSELKGTIFSRILIELERKGKLIKLENNQVDEHAVKIKGIIDDPDFDDEHIAALVSVSGCCIVCTDDKRSFPYLKRKDIYPKGVKPPKIYQRTKNQVLLCKKYTANICLKN